MLKIILVANTDWYLYNFRLSLAKQLRAEGYEVLLLSPRGRYVFEFEKAGFRWVAWEIGRKSLNPIGELKSIIELFHIYRREKADLVHLHTIKAVLYGSLAAWLAGGLKVVRSITGRGYVFLGQDFKARIIRPWVKLIYRFALRFPKGKSIFENQADLDFFCAENLITPDRAVIIQGVGVDVGYYTPLPEPQGDPVIILASRMLWDKGVGDFVEAARLLKRKLPVRCVLVGAPDEGNPANIDESQLAAWQAEGVVEYLGWQSDMRAVFAMCHIVTLPSYSEGVPTVLLEAAACARPLVATDVPGCQDVVRNKENGLLVPVRDPVALSIALKELAQSSTKRHEMGVKGRVLVEKNFSIKKVAFETLDVYLKLFP